MSRKRGANNKPRVGDVLMLGVPYSTTFIICRVTGTGKQAQVVYSEAEWLAQHLCTLFGPNKWKGPWYGPDEVSWASVTNLGPDWEVPDVKDT